MRSLRNLSAAFALGSLLPLSSDRCPAAGEGAVMLSAAAGPEGANNEKESHQVRLGVAGAGASATARFEPPSPTGAGELTAAHRVSGTFSAPRGGTLRLEFGAPPPTNAKPRRKLLAFWRFDEPNGKTAIDLKSVETPARLVGVDTDKERPKGVGFDKTHSIALDGKGHVQTAFKIPASRDGTISVWIKTKAAGAVIAESLNDDSLPAPGTKTIHVGADGHAYAQVTGGGGLSLRSPKPVNDDTWQHLVWTTSAGLHTLYVGGLAVATAEQADAAEKQPLPADGAAALKIGAAFQLPATGVGTTKPLKIPTFTGQVDNLRIYNATLNLREIKGIYEVGARRAPIVITSEPKKVIRVGETFRYALEYTGAPHAQFTFNGMPDWIEFKGLLIGAPEEKNIGLSSELIITGLCPWGPAQQQFRIKILPRTLAEGWEFGIDGKPVEFKKTPYGLEAALPVGEGQWELRKKS